MEAENDTAYLSLPLSPDQRSSSLAGVSAGSSFPRPPSSSSDLAQCADMEPERPFKDTRAHPQTNRQEQEKRKRESLERQYVHCQA